MQGNIEGGVAPRINPGNDIQQANIQGIDQNLPHIRNVLADANPPLPKADEVKKSLSQSAAQVVTKVAEVLWSRKGGMVVSAGSLATGVGLMAFILSVGIVGTPLFLLTGTTMVTGAFFLPFFIMLDEFPNKGKQSANRETTDAQSLQNKGNPALLPNSEPNIQNADSLADLRQQIQEQESTIQDLLAKVDETDKTTASNVQQIHQDAHAISQLKHKKAQLKSDKQRLMAKIGLVEKQLHLSNRQNVKLSSKNELVMAELDAAKASLEEAQATIDGINLKLHKQEHLVEKKAAKLKDRDLTIQSLSEVNSQQASELEYLKAQIAELTREKKISQARQSDLEKSNRDLQRHVEELTAQVSLLSEARGDLSQLNEESKVEVQNLQAVLDSHQNAKEKQVAQLSREISALEAKLQEATHASVEKREKIRMQLHDRQTALTTNLLSQKRDLLSGVDTRALVAVFATKLRVINDHTNKVSGKISGTVRFDFHGHSYPLNRKVLKDLAFALGAETQFERACELVPEITLSNNSNVNANSNKQHQKPFHKA